MSESESIPRHIAVIMDGNNRWARKRGLPGPAGHKAGVDTVKFLIEACGKKGVEILTLYAFSSENWQRPSTEVKALMDLFLSVLQKKEVQELHKNNVRLRFIGRRDRFKKKLVNSMSYAEQLTSDNTALTVVIAADYGGHWDICEAARSLALKVAAGQLNADDINPELFQSHIAMGDLPMPDLCIRTSGESRISNFLLWQLAYTELYFTEDYWPDFDEQSFQRALGDYASRQRRYGLSGEQIGAGGIPVQQQDSSQDDSAHNSSDKIQVNQSDPDDKSVHYSQEQLEAKQSA